VKVQISILTATLVALAGCQDAPRVTLFKPHSTPIDRRIAYQSCREASLRTDGSNADRAAYVRHCMEAKGYAMLENIPVCATPEERDRALTKPQPRKESLLKCASGIALDQ